MDMVKIAIERLKTAAEMSLLYYDKPLMLAYSGGKDSDVCLELALRAGIQFEVQHSHTTADAPETVRYVRAKFAGLEQRGIKCTIDMPRYKGQTTSMWRLIPIKKMPPTRTVRYCCAILKETAGHNRAIVTGVRRAESTKRSGRGILETVPRDISKKIILNNDNNRRKVIEHCQLQGKVTCNPIVDWADGMVWDFIRSEHLNLNPLYKCGYNRVGCIGCPMASKQRYAQFARYPSYKKMYIHAFARMIDRIKATGQKLTWQNATEVYHWWMEDGVLPGQLAITDNWED